MAIAQYDLWPATFTAVAEPNVPIDILREQADLLEQKTNGVVLAEVRTSVDAPLNHAIVAPNLPLLHTFYLVAPALGNYRYQLFRVEQPLDYYPVLIKGGPSEDVEAKSTEQFVEALRQVFAEHKTQKVIQSLIAQSQS